MLHVIMFAVYVARGAFVVVPLLYVVLNVLLVQETIKAFEFEFEFTINVVTSGWGQKEPSSHSHLIWTDMNFLESEGN